MKPHKDPTCGVCATNPFERNNYFYGKQFTVRDLVQEQSYFNDKRHLINRMILGWGVVCGLEVSWHEKSGRLMVSPGMAIDCCGREIIVCDNKCVPIDDDDDDCCKEPAEHPREGKFVLCLEYEECHAEPIDLPAVGCDEKQKTEYNRTREGFKFHLKRWDDACPKEPHEVHCPSDGKHPVTKDDPPSDCKSEDIHHYLCHKLRHCRHECKDCDCVVLATITFEPQKNEGDPKQQYQQQNQKNESGEKTTPPKIDGCTNRKLVYNNQLLYDLIYCYHGDLPHIVDFTWRKFAYPKREISFDDFLAMINKGVTVYFDQPLETSSLNVHTFMLCYLYRETGTGTYVRKQIPASAIDSKQEGNCFTATFIARPDWIKDELDSPNSELLADTRYEAGVVVEIVLRGSRIWSTKGKSLDGEYLADKLPTGNGTQGGDFVDWFRVMPSEPKRPKGRSLEGQF